MGLLYVICGGFSHCLSPSYYLTNYENIISCFGGYLLIIDLNPFLEMYNCGNRYLVNEIADLNKLIKEGFKNCECLVKN